jgi:hypothetical protein
MNKKEIIIKELNKKKVVTLPLLVALDYLYERNLTIDKLWVQDKILPGPGKYRRRETHITVKPKSQN